MSASGTISRTGGKPAPGWYSDPQGATRWWDGRAWTDHVAPDTPEAAPTTPRTATVLAPPGSVVEAPGPVAAAVAAASARANLGAIDRRTWLQWGAVGVIVALLLGYLLFGRGDEPEPPASTRHFVALTAPQKVAHVSLTSSDLPPTLTAVPVPHGTALAGPGSASLRLCGARFTSEAHRLARTSVYFRDLQGNLTGVQEQTIVYSGQAWAATAMNEWRKAVTGCNQHAFKVYGETGRTPVRYSGMTTGPVTGLPAKSSTQTSFRLDTKGGGTTYGLVILQRQGNTIDALFLLYADRTDVATASAVSGFAQISGGKLMAASG